MSSVVNATRRRRRRLRSRRIGRSSGEAVFDAATVLLSVALFVMRDPSTMTSVRRGGAVLAFQPVARLHWRPVNARLVSGTMESPRSFPRQRSVARTTTQRRAVAAIPSNDGASSSDAERAGDRRLRRGKHERDYQWTSQTLSIAVPALIGMIADPLLSLMDTGFVGRLGSVPLAALGTCTSIFHLAFNAFRASTTATTSLVASALARHSEEEVDSCLLDDEPPPSAVEEGVGCDTVDEARAVTDVSLRFGLTVGVAVTAALFFGGHLALAAMGVSSDSPLFPPADSYLRIRSLAAPAVLLITVAEGAFRGYGDTRIPLLASLVAAGVNLVLDPVFMFPMGMGVSGAAAATALSQVGAAAVYCLFIFRRRMLPRPRVGSWHAATSSRTDPPQSSAPSINRREVVLTILQANAAMMLKQGSLLLGWAYATARATRIGHAHVAAHQVALSFWLVFALIMDGAAVSAQVLMSRAWAMFESATAPSDDDTIDEDAIPTEVGSVKDNDDEDAALPPRHAVSSLTSYMTKVALGQGLASTAVILLLGRFAPAVFTTDIIVREHLSRLIPHLAWQQVLVSVTLVTESLAIGGGRFNLLAIGTALSTILAACLLRDATDIVGIWSGGIVGLFAGRFLTALLGVLDMNGAFDGCWKQMRKFRSRFDKKRRVTINQGVTT